MSGPVAHYYLAGLCVVGGVVTHLLSPDGPIPLTLILAGTGTLAKAAVGSASAAKDAAAERDQAKARAQRETQRADALFEETQTLRRQ